jgi:hypothetical protein
MIICKELFSLVWMNRDRLLIFSKRAILLETPDEIRNGLQNHLVVAARSLYNFCLAVSSVRDNVHGFRIARIFGFRWFLLDGERNRTAAGGIFLRFAPR